MELHEAMLTIVKRDYSVREDDCHYANDMKAIGVIEEELSRSLYIPYIYWLNEIDTADKIYTSKLLVSAKKVTISDEKDELFINDINLMSVAEIINMIN